MAEKNSAYHRLFIATFIAVITIPLVGSFVGFRNGNSTAENRIDEKFPRFEVDTRFSEMNILSKIKDLFRSTRRFIVKFDRFYGENFGFRADFLKLHLNIKSDLLNCNPIPDKVVKGEHGWYFLGDSYSNEIKESMALENFSDRSLKQTLDSVEEHSRWLQQRRIKFYLAVAPNKTSVYGDSLGIVRSDRPTCLEQLMLNAPDHFRIVDLKSNYPFAKNEQLFLKTDSHWTDYGAYLAYKSLIENIREDFSGTNLPLIQHFRTDTTIVMQQDLTKLLGIFESEKVIKLSPETDINTVIQPKRLQVPVGYNRAPDDYEHRYRSDANHIKAVIFHDSFTTALMKFLQYDFGETVFVWDYGFDKQLILRENPDVVIQIFVERNLEALRK